MHLNESPKIELRGPGPLVANVIVNYCCTHLLRTVVHKAAIEKTETEETVGFFRHIFFIGDISMGERAWVPSGYAYVS